MKLKLTFKEGEIISPSRFLAYIDEAPPKIETSGKKRRRVLVKDIRNNEIFEADFDSIGSGGTTSSPSMRSQLASERAKQNEAIKNSSQKRRKYNVGNIIGPDDQIKNIFCKENKIPLIRIPYYDYDKLDWRYLWDKIKLYL